MKSVLGIIASELKSIGVPYEFMRWTSAVQYPYFVGEYTETPTLTEDGKEEGTLILTGYTRGSWFDLEQMKTKIKSHFPNVYGLRKSTDDGALVISYRDSMPVDSGEAELKKIQITLDIKQWKGVI